MGRYCTWDQDLGGSNPAQGRKTVRYLDYNQAGWPFHDPLQLLMKLKELRGRLQTMCAIILDDLTEVKKFLERRKLSIDS